MSRPAAAQDVAIAAIMVAMIEACKLCMQALPNIELTSFLLILFSLRFRRLTLYVVPVFTLIEGLLYGFGLWWVMYLYAWPLLTLAVRPFEQVDSAFFWAVFSGVFGLLFGLLVPPPVTEIPYRHRSFRRCRSAPTCPACLHRHGYG